MCHACIGRVRDLIHHHQGLVVHLLVEAEVETEGDGHMMRTKDTPLEIAVPQQGETRKDITMTIKIGAPVGMVMTEGVGGTARLAEVGVRAEVGDGATERPHHPIAPPKKTLFIA